MHLADQQPRHDHLPGAGVVGAQEPHARQLQQVIVDRLQLVRQRIDAGDQQPEVGIELPGDPERVASNPSRNNPPSPSYREPLSRTVSPTRSTWPRETFRKVFAATRSEGHIQHRLRSESSGGCSPPAGLPVLLTGSLVA